MKALQKPEAKLLINAAQQRKLDLFSAEMLTEENLRAITIREEGAMLFPNSNHNTFHAAAGAGCLGQIPSKFLTVTNLTTPADDEPSARYMNAMDTPLHCAGRAGNIGLIPREVLENLPASAFQAQNKDRNTPIHGAAYTGTLRAVPEKAKTVEALLKKDKSGRSAIRMAAERGFIGQIEITPELAARHPEVAAEVVIGVRAALDSQNITRRAMSDIKEPIKEWREKFDAVARELEEISIAV